ncbi:N-acetylmuramoyl-L-alanine amidase, partial [Aurantibacter sp.]|uniref:N-acetylmuramoyl-L-alanine amidase family protein n=1 Tax=Aurantibacter sp. TaxID=2807103 RepID=UPI0035C7CDA4
MKLRIYICILFCFICFNTFSQTIVIDPGHGYCADCTQSCTSNVRSNTEILTAMSVGNKLSTLLQNCPSVTSYLTRTTSGCGDFPSLSQRAAMSNSWSADRFLSIHCNAGGGSGTETFWCDNSSSSNAACENFATEVQTQMVTYGDWNSRRVVEDDSYLNFHLGVLSPTNAIGCLSEIGFVDSADATKLLDDTWRNQFALAYYISLQNDLGITTCTGLDCSSAIPVTCGNTYNGSSSSATSLVDTYGCNTWTESGPERVHTITPTSNGTLTASLSNFTGDLDVYILGSCNPNDCLGTVSSSSATYTNAIAGTTYYIVVDADDGSGSSYDLTVTCPIEDIYINNINSNTNSLAPGYDITITANQNYTGASTNIYDSYLY